MLLIHVVVSASLRDYQVPLGTAGKSQYLLEIVGLAILGFMVPALLYDIDDSHGPMTRIKIRGDVWSLFGYNVSLIGNRGLLARLFSTFKQTRDPGSQMPKAGIATYRDRP
jgi:hypothetical protein